MDDATAKINPDGAEEALADQLDNVVPSQGYQKLPVVALGGSDSGIAGLHTFFRALPPETGLAFAVVLHLSPYHDSSLAEALRKSTTMRVVQVSNTVEFEADTVYVIPPGSRVLPVDGGLELTELPGLRHRQTAVDLFFRTLAETHGPHATAIVLSGVDGDGAVGLKRIKERGGLTIAQDPDEAEHSDMPRAALSTGMVDWVLPAGEIAGRVLDYYRLEQRLSLPPEEGPLPPQTLGSPNTEDEAALRDVIGFLRKRTGRDFANYKRPTIVRRIGRRMQVNGIETLPGYLAYLRTRPSEASALLQDLLISVTNFFRDADCFAALEARLPDLFRDKGPSDTVRVWVAACATGEEAYSIAILLAEHAATLDAAPLIQVFASDLDDEAVRTARNGIYPSAIVADVSDERLRRYFLKEQRGYRVRREIREMVLFAMHDLLKDSPFSRLDLVTCRNLLIYLNRDAQARVLETFHFSLLPGGLMFLGASESVDDGSALFQVLDKKSRIYAKRSAARLHMPVPSSPGVLALAMEVQHAVRSGPVIASSAFAPPPAAQGAARRLEGRAGSWGELHFRLIEHIGPPSIMVDAEYDILHLSPSAGRFLRHAGGEPTRNLLRSIHPALRIELRAALYRATQSDSLVEVPPVEVDIDGTPVPVVLRVVPAADLAPGVMLVLLLPAGLAWAPALATATPMEIAPSCSGDSVAQHLDRELERLKSHLRDTVEQYEGTTEELKASNEELQAMNEELRSAGEELETSREELQSINEELTTVNHELEVKVGELGHANSDMHNLMDATAIATVFLDRDLRITRFTPSAVSLFNLISTDVGRPLSDLKTGLDYPGLAGDARRVLERLVPIEKEVGAPNGWYLVRGLPYRTLDDRIAGVVMTFVDISERKTAGEALARSEERLRLMVENAVEYAIFSTDCDRVITAWNPGAERLLGYTEPEILGQRADTIYVPEDLAAGIPALETSRALAEGRASDDRWHQRKDGSRFWANGAMMPMRNGPGAVVGFVKILRDQTQERETQAALEGQRKELAEALHERRLAATALEAAHAAKDRFLATLSHELRNPLASIHGAAQALVSDRIEQDERAHAARIVLRQSSVIKSLLDDLLDVSRVGLGRLVLRRQRVALADVVAAALEATRPLLDAACHALEVDLPAGPVELDADPVRLSQVLSNLLANAARYTPAGGTVALRAHTEGGEAVFTVEDNGIGMEPGRIPDLFEMFAQGPDAAGKSQGLGIGLALVRNIMALHGGTVSADSAGPGMGSTFTVRLPLPGLQTPTPASAPVAAPGHGAPETAGTAAGTQAAPCLVLVADDNADAAWSVGKMLESLGCEVVTAGDGRMALEVAGARRPDIAMLDIGMPVLSGHDVARRIRAEPWGAGMLLVAATGWGQESDRLAATQAGFDDYLVKPVGLQALRAVVARFMPESRTSQPPSVDGHSGPL